MIPIYRRVIIKITLTHYVFVYAARQNKANCIEIGLGYETRNTLQRIHVASQYVHEFDIEDRAVQIAQMGVMLKTGRLQAHFDGLRKLLVQDDNGVSLANAMREVRDEAWPKPVPNTSKAFDVA